MLTINNYPKTSLYKNNIEVKNRQLLNNTPQPTTTTVSFSGNPVKQFLEFFETGKRTVKKEELLKTLAQIREVDGTLCQNIEASIINTFKKATTNNPPESIEKLPEVIEFGTKVPFIKTLIKSILLPVFSAIKFTNFLFEKGISFFKKDIPETAEQLKEKTTKETKKSIDKTLDSIHTQLEVFKKLHKESNGDKTKLEKSIGKYMLSNLAGKNKTNYDPSTYSIFNKLLASAVTAVFLASDQFNFTMKQTNGDTQQAKAQTRQRVLQDIMRVAFSSWIVGAGTSTFRDFNNSSLANMSIVTASTCTGYETLTRSAVGAPFVPSSKAQIEENEKRTQNMKGPIGAFFRFVAKVTGKKSLSKRVTKQDKPPVPAQTTPTTLNTTTQQAPSFQNKKPLNKFV
ncbi:MAG: hypothetical protein WCK67_06410 [bacterium]